MYGRNIYEYIYIYTNVGMWRRGVVLLLLLVCGRDGYFGVRAKIGARPTAILTILSTADKWIQSGRNL